MRHEFTCSNCDEEKVHDSGISTGYGLDEGGNKICFECCGKRDRQTMIDKGHSKNLPLYLTLRDNRRHEVSNWPGTLRFVVISSRTSRHNFAGERHDVWFVGPDGFVWHGYQIGQWNQICHCRRTKDKRKAA